VGERSQPITQLLRSWRAGDEAALGELMPIVYRELRNLAGRCFRGENPDNNMLSPTALVHEAYLKLIDTDVPWQDRVHLFAVAARMMRRILVDHARAQRRLKRGGDLKVTLSEPLAPAHEPRILELNDALTRLGQIDPRKCEVVELTFFGGLTYAEVAMALDISEATVHRHLTMAKAWLYDDMKARDGV
jgi:RNA polymerase sigma factor (TIGR02999 family)